MCAFISAHVHLMFWYFYTMQALQGWASGISVPARSIITGRYFNLGYLLKLTHVKKCLFTLSPSYSVHQPSHSSQQSPWSIHGSPVQAALLCNSSAGPKDLALLFDEMKLALSEWQRCWRQQWALHYNLLWCWTAVALLSSLLHLLKWLMGKLPQTGWVYFTDILPFSHSSHGFVLLFRRWGAFQLYLSIS